jgi:AraC family transcriptional regulator
VSITSKALWYIESHLNTGLSLEAVADSVGVSRFHLSRAFAASTGIPLAGYLRSRRLTEAAKSLAAGAPDILGVALDAGYGSHEAFTRAFRLQFQMTPEQLRTQGHLNNIQLQEPKRMNPSSISPLPSPRIEKSDALLIFGLARQCKAVGDPGIPAQWNSFAPHIGHIDGQIGAVTYGVCYNSDDSGNYDYLCGVAVQQFPSSPREFTRLRIPEQTYAVFEHRDHVSSIAGTFRAIWEHGLADAGLRALDAPLFERYGEQFDGRTGLGGLEIWIPIQS